MGTWRAIAIGKTGNGFRSFDVQWYSIAYPQRVITTSASRLGNIENYMVSDDISGSRAESSQVSHVPPRTFLNSIFFQWPSNLCTRKCMGAAKYKIRPINIEESKKAF